MPTCSTCKVSAPLTLAFRFIQDGRSVILCRDCLRAGPMKPGTRWVTDVFCPCTVCDRPTQSRLLAVNRDPKNPHADGATFGAALCPGCNLPPVGA